MAAFVVLGAAGVVIRLTLPALGGMLVLGALGLLVVTPEVVLPALKWALVAWVMALAIRWSGAAAVAVPDIHPAEAGRSVAEQPAPTRGPSSGREWWGQAVVLGSGGAGRSSPSMATARGQQSCGRRTGRTRWTSAALGWCDLAPGAEPGVALRLVLAAVDQHPRRAERLVKTGASCVNCHEGSCG